MDALKTLSSNRLKINPLKTEHIWLHRSRRNLVFLGRDIELCGSDDILITPVKVALHSGVLLTDENLSMSEDILWVCHNCNYQLCQIRRVEKSLSTS